MRVHNHHAINKLLDSNRAWSRPDIASAANRPRTVLEDPDVQSLAVMDGDHLRGIVTRADLLRVVL